MILRQEWTGGIGWYVPEWHLFRTFELGKASRPAPAEAKGSASISGSPQMERKREGKTTQGGYFSPIHMAH